jgi:predicted nucleic acid-binding protein
MNRYCIDASALFIYVTKKDEDSELWSLVGSINEGRSEGLISTVNLAEFHRGISRKYSKKIADKHIIWVRESRISIVTLDEETALLASKKKQHYARAGSPFAWGDAFCLATALEMNCDCLVTSDSEFDKVKDIEILKV